CSNSASTWSSPPAGSSCICPPRRLILTRGATSPWLWARAQVKRTLTRHNSDHLTQSGGAAFRIRSPAPYHPASSRLHPLRRRSAPSNHDLALPSAPAETEIGPFTNKAG